MASGRFRWCPRLDQEEKCRVNLGAMVKGPLLRLSDYLNAGQRAAAAVAVFDAAVDVGVQRVSAVVFQPAAAGVLRAGAAAAVSAVEAFVPSALVAHDVAEAVVAVGLRALPKAFARAHCSVAD